MNVEINKHTVAVESGIENLAQLLESKNLVSPGTAVAVDNAVVPRAKWGDTPLADGMKITVITAVCGG